MDVHQLVSSIAVGDAVSNAAFSLQRLLRGEGIQSQIYAEQIDPEYSGRCLHLGKYPLVDSPENILIAHYSIASMGMVTLPYFKARKILFYHNVTPYKYWLNINPLAAFHCLRGKTDLMQILPFVNYGVAFSQFSLQDLRNGGLQRTSWLPLQIDSKRLEAPPDPVTMETFKSKERKILVVGRIAPNKKVEDAISIASQLSNVRLIFVGTSRDALPYYLAVRQAAKNQKAKCDFLGLVTQEELNALYRIADVLLVVSEHEGFCVPILEAFHFNLPVIAYAAGAIPETSNGGALLFDTKKPEIVAPIIEKVLTDQTVRESLQRAGKIALKKHLEFPVRDELMKIIQEVAELPALYREREQHEFIAEYADIAVIKK
jgi:glycosyltransferase involved in cell wall biosynthesis